MIGNHPNLRLCLCPGLQWDVDKDGPRNHSSLLGELAWVIIRVNNIVTPCCSFLYNITGRRPCDSLRSPHRLRCILVDVGCIRSRLNRSLVTKDGRHSSQGSACRCRARGCRSSLLLRTCHCMVVAKQRSLLSYVKIWQARRTNKLGLRNWALISLDVPRSDPA